MRISDWSPDVCSSDLLLLRGPAGPIPVRSRRESRRGAGQHDHLPERVQRLGPPGPGSRRDVRHPDESDLRPRRSTMFRVANFAQHQLTMSYAMRTQSNWTDRQIQIASGKQGQLYSRSEEQTSELQSLMRTSYAVFCL